MAYFDWSANYPVNEEVLKTFLEVERKCRGNANSIHREGKESFGIYKIYNQKMLDLLGLSEREYEIIYTSSATESNNLVIQGVYKAYQGLGNKIVASEVEHSSINASLSSLKDEGANIVLVPSTSEGTIDLEKLEDNLDSSTILTCLTSVDGELGFLEPIEKAQELVEKKTNGFLLVDATQMIGKFKMDFSKFDFVSFAPHKYGGIIGTGILVKRKGIVLSPLLHGGSSVSIYRSGTPAIGLIASTVKATEIALNNQKNNYQKTKEMQRYLIEGLQNTDGILINSSLENPYILNVSIQNKKGNEVVKELDKRGFEVSQKSACSIPNTPSKPVMSVYHDKKRATSSFRISLCDLNTEEEVASLLKAIKEIANGR